jgi:hypothetical protein
MTSRNTKRDLLDDEKEISEIIKRNELENSALKKLLDFLEKQRRVWTKKHDKSKHEIKECQNP